MASEGVGHVGPVEALSGRSDKTSSGLASNMYTVTLTAGVGVAGTTLLAPANPNRIAAIIYRDDTEPTRVVEVAFGPRSTVLAGEPPVGVVHLWPRGNIQIDRLFPWSGPVSIGGAWVAATADAVIRMLEISLP